MYVLSDFPTMIHEDRSHQHIHILSPESWLTTCQQVLDSWSAAEDSDVEREKAKVAAEKKAKADAEAAANKKSKAQRVAERIAAKKLLLEQNSDYESEDETTKRAFARQAEINGDLEHATDLFGDVAIGHKDDMYDGIGIPNTRRQKTAANAVVVDEKDPSQTVDLETLPLFKPQTKKQFDMMKEALVPLLKANVTKPHYELFMQDFARQICMDMNSDQIKKVASKLTALGNEKQKEEKETAKGGKKTKAQKSKISLSAGRNVASGKDTTTYDDDDYGE